MTLFNASFKHGVLSLAEELNASEHYCARLLEHVLPDATQSVNAVTVQRAILSRYDERTAMLASFRLIFEAATIVDAPQSRLSDFLQKFMFDAVQGPYSGGIGQPAVNFASKVVSEIDAIAGEISKLDACATSKLVVHWALNISLNSRRRCGCTYRGLDKDPRPKVEGTAPTMRPLAISRICCGSIAHCRRAGTHQVAVESFRRE